MSVDDSARNLRPLKFEPLFVPRIWGAQSLEPLYHHNASEQPIGEVWLTGNECVCSTPPFAGQKLKEIWRTMSPEWAGLRANKDAPFPLLVKFLFPEDKLSVQVHPDDAFAREHDAAAGGTGKTESWYVVHARAGAEVFAGLQGGATKETFRRKITDGTVEDCLNRVPVSEGDAIFIPAGTAHTIGAGSVLCEVQQHSDLTYRVFDYNRRNPDGTTRELHIEKAMAVLNFGAQHGGKLRPVTTHTQGAEITHFVVCRYFALERWTFANEMSLRTEPEHFELWVTLSGRGKITWSSDSMSYAPGDIAFIPAALAQWRIEPEVETKMVHTYVPDLEIYRQQLVAAGVSAEDAARVIAP